MSTVRDRSSMNTSQRSFIQISYPGNLFAELKNYLEDELLDLAVENLAMFTENASAVQSAQMRINTNE